MKKTYYPFTILSALFASLFFYAFASGITGVTRKSSSPGCTCHGTLTSSVIVNISGPDTIRTNDSANFFVTLSGGLLVMGGTNIAAKLGTLVPGKNLRISGGELTHIAPVSPQGNTVIFPFRYKSPSIPGTDTIFANGNSVNFNGFSSGDNWNYAPNKKIVITSPTGIVNNNATANSFSLEQNYPNPFNPSTLIKFSIQKNSDVLLVIYNSLGELIQEAVNTNLKQGSYSVNWDASKYPGGVYFYSLKTKENSITKKMILVK